MFRVFFLLIPRTAEYETGWNIREDGLCDIKNLFKKREGRDVHDDKKRPSIV